jgi:hypothetical protein
MATATALSALIPSWLLGAGGLGADGALAGGLLSGLFGADAGAAGKKSEEDGEEEVDDDEKKEDGERSKKRRKLLSGEEVDASDDAAAHDGEHAYLCVFLCLCLCLSLSLCVCLCVCLCVRMHILCVCTGGKNAEAEGVEDAPMLTGSSSLNAAAYTDDVPQPEDTHESATMLSSLAPPPAPPQVQPGTEMEDGLTHPLATVSVGVVSDVSKALQATISHESSVWWLYIGNILGH